MPVVNFLLGDQAGPALRHLVQPGKLEVRHLVLRLQAVQFLPGSVHLALGIRDVGLVLVQLHLEFGDFQNRHHIALLHVCAVIHVELSDESGLLGIDIDLLEGNQLGGDYQASLQRLSDHSYHAGLGDLRGLGRLPGRAGPPAAGCQETS